MIKNCNFSRHRDSCLKNGPKEKKFQIKEEWLVSDNLYKCPICEKCFSKLGMVSHYFSKHTNQGRDFRKNHRGNKDPHIAWNKGKLAVDDHRILSKYDPSNVFAINSDPIIAKKVFIRNHGYSCTLCGISSWKDKPITLCIHHVNGNNRDQSLDNLMLLCPNCHSQTDSFSLSKGKTRKISDYQIISAMQISESLRECILILGLSDSGANYKRIRKIAEECSCKLMD